jgi:nucleotide-binding universal stress UspA family protein
MMEKILLSVDTPASAQAAVEYIADIAKANQSEVTILHTYKPEPPSAFSTYFLGFSPGKPSIQDKGMLADSVERLKRLGVENVKGKLVHDKPMKALKKAARSLEPDLIVIGSGGHIYPVSTDSAQAQDLGSLKTSEPLLIV